MKRINTLILILTLLTGSAFAQPFGENLMFTANMSGAEEVPSVPTAARGVAVAILSPNLDTLCITSSWNGLSGPAVLAHVHMAPPGQSGPPVIDLTPFISVDGNQLGTTITGAALTPQVIESFLKGEYYINVHTDSFPTGEIRGQFRPEVEETFVARMNGQEQVPPTASTGRGLALFQLSMDKQLLRFHVINIGLTGNTFTVDLHEGTPGSNGPVLFDLTPFAINLSNSYVVGTVDSSDATFDGLVNSLISGNAYVDVHTDSSLNGEIRGQLQRARGITFWTKMDNAQEVPPAISTNGLGLGYFSLSPAMDSLHYTCVFGGLSGIPTMAHLHTAPPGVSGSVAVDLSDGLIGALALDGVVSGPNVNTGLLRDMLKGNIYVNIHTPIDPDGELRGQLIPTARTGYTFVLDGEGLNPPVTTDGYGFGYVSIDPMQSIGQYSFVYGGVNSDITNATFNYGPTGVSGPWFFETAPFISDNYATGYWFASDTVTPLLPGLAQTLYNDSVYFLINTLDNPVGELRGQLMSGLVCNAFETDTATAIFPSIDYDRELNVYPNPADADGLVTARYVSQSNVSAVITLHDMLGKKVYEQRVNVLQGTNSFKIDLSSFGQGVYTVRLNVGEHQYTQRVTKQ